MLGIGLKTLARKLEFLGITPLQDPEDKRARVITGTQVTQVAYHLKRSPVPYGPYTGMAPLAFPDLAYGPEARSPEITRLANRLERLEVKLQQLLDRIDQGNPPSEAAHLPGAPGAGNPARDTASEAKGGTASPRDKG